MSDPDQRLVDAVDQYLQSIETGCPISQEQLLADYADIESELRDCLGSLDFLNKAQPEFRTVASSEIDCEEGFQSPPTTDALADSVLGDYRLKQQIGRGGMGVVYDAEQLSLQRRVAVKVLPFAAALDERRLQRFRHEAMSAAALHHPHIVPVFLVGHEKGTHFYVMQLVEGQSLAEFRRKIDVTPAAPANDDTDEVANALTQSGIDDGLSDFRQLARLFAPIADALEHAHEAGIVHRDVKPSNLLLDRNGKLWLTDFGLAMRIDNQGLTQTGDIVGTLKYMSPEQILGNRSTVDHRSDVYSLGLSLYECLARRPAFEATNRANLVQQISNSEPPSLRSLNAAIPADLRTVVEKAIARDPADRYQTAAAFAEDLRSFSNNQPVNARRPSIRRRLARLAKRHHRAVTAATIVGLLAVGGLIAGNVAMAAEQRRTQAALANSQDLLKEYQATLKDVSTIINRHQLYEEPTYAAMIRDFAETMNTRSKLLQQLARNDSDVRESLLFNLRSVAAASLRSGDTETSASLYQQVRWLAEREVVVARKKNRQTPAAEFVSDLARGLHALGRAELYDGIDDSDGAPRFKAGIRTVSQGVEDYPENGNLWYWLGRLKADQARIFEADTDKKIAGYQDAANAYRRSLELSPYAPTRNRLAFVLGRICDLQYGKKNYTEALAASKEHVRLLADACAESFTQAHCEAYCDALPRHIDNIAQTRRIHEMADVTDEYLRVARRGYKEFGTTDLRRAFISACGYRLRDMATSAREKKAPIALLREARRAIYFDNPKAGRNTLFSLSVIANALVYRMLADESLPADTRLEAFREMAFTCRLQADIRRDTNPADTAIEDMLEGYLTQNEHLKALLADEAAAKQKEESDTPAPTRQ